MGDRGEKFRGDNLRMARLVHGYSLEQLGELVAATRQFMHQLEVGAKSPTVEMEHALADVLEVNTSFFKNPIENFIRQEQCHFRKREATPVAIAQQVLARGSITDLLVAQLDRVLALPKVNFPDYPVRDTHDIERAAERAREHWGLGLMGPIVNITRVAENAGAVVTEFDALSERVDALSMDRPRPIIARNAAKESLCRQRFDVAHEIGHLIMHRGIPTGDRETEAQAHRFAGAFLIPRAAFSREFPRSRRLNWSGIFEMKLRWKVAARAIIRRAYDLDLIDAAQYRTANIYLVKTGQTKVEQHDQEMTLEVPELFSAAIDALSRLSPDAVWNFADDVGLRHSLIEKLTGVKFPEPSFAETPHNVVRVNFSR